jgi:hypothetical protein
MSSKARRNLQVRKRRRMKLTKVDKIIRQRRQAGLTAECDWVRARARTL